MDSDRFVQIINLLSGPFEKSLVNDIARNLNRKYFINVLIDLEKSKSRKNI